MHARTAILLACLASQGVLAGEPAPTPASDAPSASAARSAPIPRSDSATGSTADAATVADAGAATYRGRSVQQWVEQLASPDIQTRWYATYALGQLGPGAEAAVEPLMRILENQREYEYVRGGAAWALGRIGLPAAGPAVPLLIDTLSSRHLSVRRNAPWALAQLAPAAGDAVPRLRELLADEDIGVRLRAAAALWVIDKQPKALAALRETVRGGGADACAALEMLGHIEPAAATNALLIEALAAPDAEVRRTAAWALAQQGPDVLPALEGPLGAADVATRRAAVEVLGYLGPAAVETLVRVLTDQAAEVRMAGARELGRLGPVARCAESALVKSLSDTDAGVRHTAAWALRRLRAESD